MNHNMVKFGLLKINKLRVILDEIEKIMIFNSLKFSNFFVESMHFSSISTKYIIYETLFNSYSLTYVIENMHNRCLHICHCLNGGGG